jgi:leucyl-tRNA synthetase
MLLDDVVRIAVQVSGKLRGDLEIARSAGETEVVEAAKTHERVAKHLEGKQLVKTIYVPGKLVNLVVR